MQQSELALFALELQRALAPLLAELGAALERLRATDRRAELPFAVDELERGLAAVAEELGALLERVALERATVFVLGPAKGGKSTLLDALAGTRLSEVSILPGYPCVLRARHAPEEAATLVRFDGSVTALADPAALRLVLQRAHGELAARAREARAAGETFDPARHLQSAVRRVERAQPAELLARGALELVECPPIHAVLFPSYAEMLIGEPDHARAAVFVVRAAQLYDDAVFDGIEELFAAFERLILVVNLDERGRELSRAGELAASSEREDPARLIAAFEELSTCEPLVRAVRSGAVPVLALDLLEAARARLHGVEETPAAAARQRTRFQDLLRELSAVLDAHEAFRALAQSALRRAGELVEEARELAGTPGLGELFPRRQAAEQERAALEGVRHALGRLEGRARALWETEELFEGLRARVAARTAARARELAQELDVPFARVLEDWFAGASSLQELMDAGLAPRLAAARTELLHAAERIQREELKEILAGPALDTLLSASARTDLEQARFALGALLAPCAERVRSSLEAVQLRVLDVEAIPVRPRLGQRLLWRDAAEVRRALFGPPEAPTRSLASADKARRLGDGARAVMQRSAAERAQVVLEEEARQVARALGEALLSGFQAELQQHVAREGARLAGPARELEMGVAELAALADALGALAPACARAQAGLTDMVERFERAGMLVPLPRAAREPQASPREGEPVLD